MTTPALDSQSSSGHSGRILLRILSPIFGLLIFSIALWVLHRQLEQYHYRDLVQRLKEIPTYSIFLALALAILNYAVLTLYDTMGFRYIGRPFEYRKIALASFIAYAFSHNVGFGLVAGGSVRFRLYSGWGFSALQITKVVAFCSLTFCLGFLATSGLAFVTAPLVIPSSIRFPFHSVRPLGIVFLAIVVAYLLLSVLRKKPFKIRGWEFAVPRFSLALPQVGFAVLDWASVGTVLYVVLSPSASLSYPAFLGIFLLSQIVGMGSQVPGGLGVFESVIILLLSPYLPASEVLGSLIAYRGIYYLLPLILGASLLGTHEILQRREDVRWVGRLLGQWIPALAPNVLAFTTVVGGAILLFSGALPGAGGRLKWLNDFLPLPVLEVSHFLGSLAGIGLLLLARGLQRRIDAAYVLSSVLLAGGILFSLLKGFDYEEAIALGIMLGALLPCRSYFYRKASLISRRFSLGWTAAIALVLVCSVWLGLFAHKYENYSQDLWWQFALDGDAPRFLRATAGAVGLVLILAVAKLLRPAPPKPKPAGIEDLDKARAVVEKSPRVYAHLALLGDKSFLFNEKGSAFIMYGIEGRSWVALGDPVGPHEERTELIWRFREMCDRYGGRTIFYQVQPGALPLYVDLGLTLVKLGEEGRVPLETFSLEGGARRELRQTCHRVQRSGCSFEWLPVSEVPAMVPELKPISDAWLAGKNTREKRFSVGFFDPEYLKQFPMAVVRTQEKMVAFANVLLGAEKEELSLDLMRYLPDAPNGVMEYLFIELMLWGKQEGYRWFNLGTAPFSGLEDRELAPLWSRLGAIVFRHGEHFYNFQGIRQYKEKFDPVWEPRYLASPGGLALPRIVTDIASLTSGDLKGVVAK